MPTELPVVRLAVPGATLGWPAFEGPDPMADVLRSVAPSPPCRPVPGVLPVDGAAAWPASRAPDAAAFAGLPEAVVLGAGA